MTAPHISVKSASIIRPHPDGTREVLRDLTLEVQRGERVALVGPNGSGKSTLLRLMLGFELPDRGTVEYCSEGVVAYIPQDYRSALFPWLRLSSNLALAIRELVPNESESRETATSKMQFSYEMLAEAFRLTIDLEKYPYQLSGGEQQLFLLARAVLAKPELLVLDEPLSAVDYVRRRLVLECLGRWLPLAGCTLVIASHDFEEAVILADRAVVLAERPGRVKSTINVPLPWPRGMEMCGTQPFRDALEAVTKAVI